MENVPAEIERLQWEQEMPTGIERRLVLRLLAHWRALCGDRKLPAASDIDPTAIPELWPHSFLLDIDRNGGRHVVRALGNEIDSDSGNTLAGTPVADVSLDTLPGMALTYLDEVLEKGVPISRGGEFVRPDGTRVLYRSVLLPVGDDECSISCILGAANCREVVEN